MSVKRSPISAQIKNNKTFEIALEVDPKNGLNSHREVPNNQDAQRTNTTNSPSTSIIREKLSKNWSEQCATPSVNFTTTNANDLLSNLNTPTPNSPKQKPNQQHITNKDAENKNVSNPVNNSVTPKQCGMDKYVNIIKRKLSPKSISSNPPKVTKTNETRSILSGNRFAILADDKDAQATTSRKPPPIYLRERNSNSLIKALSQLIGEDAFHVTSIRRGNINETKIQIYDETKYRSVINNLDRNGKNYYTYQLKTSKGLVVVIRGIEPGVDQLEIKEALEEKGYKIKSVYNIKNREKIPAPLYKIELEPDTKKYKANEPHPIYSLQLLLHRKISVEEPHKRKAPVQCTNCQEYGHSKTYCTLRSVCVACGDFHPTKDCQTNKNDPNKKRCSNCGENHTANYRGCAVYIAEKRKLFPAIRPRTQASNPLPNQVQPSETRAYEHESTTHPQVTYASVIKGSQPKPEVPHNAQNMQQNNNLEVMMQTFIQSISQFMNTMQNMMQDMMRNQNLLLQQLLQKP